MNEYTKHLDLFFNCAEHSNKRECLEGILENIANDKWRKGFQDGIESVARNSDEAIEHLQKCIGEIETMKTWVNPEYKTL